MIPGILIGTARNSGTLGLEGTPTRTSDALITRTGAAGTPNSLVLAAGTLPDFSNVQGSVPAAASRAIRT